MKKSVPAVTIREAVPERDLSSVIALNRFVQDLHVAGEPSLFRDSDDLPGIGEFHTGFMEGEDRYTFVAEVGEEVVGYVSLELLRRPDQTFTRGRDRLYVHQLSVHPRHRRRGVGQTLMSRVEGLARELGVSEIALDTWSFNQDALQFFESIGYTGFMVRFRKTGI